MNNATEPTTTFAIRMPASMKTELADLARSTGRNRNALAVEALSRFIDVERWQIADIKAGLDEADAGDFATADEMDAVFDEYAAHRDQGGERRAG
jgi:predicted transcriptional regulator